MGMLVDFIRLGLMLGSVAAQFQDPQQQQQQFGNPQQGIDPRQQQQFPGGPGQQQFPAPGQFGQGNAQQPGQPFGAQSTNFGPGVAPQQPPLDPFNPNQQQSNQMQGGGQQFGGPGGIPPGIPSGGVAGGGAGSGGPQVKITTDLFPVESAQHMDRIHWTEPKSDPIYCVSAQPATSLQFFCFDCNTTYGHQFNEYLRQGTTNYQSAVGYPAIKLSPIPIIGQEVYMKTLSCVAFYGSSTGGQQLNNTASSTIILQYLATPLLLDRQGHGPLYLNPHDGYIFYIPQSSGFQVNCYALGNPPPTSFNWTVNGAPVPNAGQQSSLMIDAQTFHGKAISCRAFSTIFPLGRESGPVGIMTWIPPQVTANNFQNLQQQASLFEPGTTNVQLNKNMQLQCAVTGLPVPWIWWRQELSTGYVVNASCEPKQDTAPTFAQAGQPIYAVTSSCTVNINNYTKVGRYWCSACNYLAAGTYQCIPEERVVSPSSFRVDVIGQPMVSQDDIRYEAADAGSVRVGLPYCANPEPQLPDGIYWLINGQRLNIRNEMENYLAEAPEQNTTVPNCWISRLRIRSVSDADRTKTFRLVVTNSMGNDQREFRLDQLNSTRSALDEEGRVGLAVGLTLGLFFLILLISCAFCWWRGLLCFGKTKKRTPTAQPPKPTKEKLPTNVAPDTIRTTPSGVVEKMPPTISRPPYDVPPSEPLHGNGSSSPGGRRKHEGLNYAELDLVKDSHRPLQPTPIVPTPTSTSYRPTADYVRFQQPAPTSTTGQQLKSPTNSTV